jgi:hypothetical protein
MAAGYIALRLADSDAGGAVVDRPSSGFVGLYDVRTGELAPDLCELWGLQGDLSARRPRRGGRRQALHPGGGLDRPSAGDTACRRTR